MKAYLLTIIWTMLFVVIVEMIFPVSELKKYLKLVLSFIVVATIVNPIMTLVINQQWVDVVSPEEYVQFYQQQFEKGAYTPYEVEKQKLEEDLKQMYQEQIETQVKRLIESKLPVQVESLSSQIKVEDNVVGISQITLEVMAKEKESLIQIGDKSESFILNEDHVKNQIKKCINDFYNVDNDNIYIIVQDS